MIGNEWEWRCYRRGERRRRPAALFDGDCGRSDRFARSVHLVGMTFVASGQCGHETVVRSLVSRNEVCDIRDSHIETEVAVDAGHTRFGVFGCREVLHRIFVAVRA